MAFQSNHYPETLDQPDADYDAWSEAIDAETRRRLYELREAVYGRTRGGPRTLSEVTVMTAQDRMIAEYAKLTEYEQVARSVYEAVAQTPEQLASRVATRAYSPRRMQHHLVIAGPAADVQLYVGMMLATDRCTPQYEHMLWRIMSVIEQNGVGLVELGRTSYAGD